MDEKFFVYMSDPQNAKLLLEIYERKRVTTAQLLEKFSDIPQATLYRRLKKMLADGIVKVVEENPIRGTVEKVYTLNYDLDEAWKNLSESNDGRALHRYITYSMLGILREFEQYAAKEDINFQEDGIGFFVAPVYATTEELRSALGKMGEALAELTDNAPNGERTLRNIAITITPPKD